MPKTFPTVLIIFPCTQKSPDRLFISGPHSTKVSELITILLAWKSIYFSICGAAFPLKNTVTIGVCYRKCWMVGNRERRKWCSIWFFFLLQPELTGFMYSICLYIVILHQIACGKRKISQKKKKKIDSLSSLGGGHITSHHIHRIYLNILPNFPHQNIMPVQV